MYIFEIGDMVLYLGDNSDPQRNRRSLAYIDKIDEEKFPWVGLRMWPSGEFIGVRSEFIRSINTKPAHLIKLGFEEKEVQGRPYYELNGLYVANIYVIIKPGHYYIPKFRFLPSPLTQINVEDYLKEGTDDSIDDTKFLEDFPDANNLNHLLNFLQKKGVNVPSIEEFSDLELK